MRIDLSWRFLRVWQRNLAVYRRTWKISFLPPLCEPLLYLAAFGIGLASLVGGLTFRGETISYLDFITPSILAVTMMFNAFFETAYASFVRMYYQKTFDAMLATPLNLTEVITGEIAWAATKSVIAATLMLLTVSLFGLVAFPSALLVVPLALLGGLAFGTFGMIFTSLMPNIETFNIPVFLLITPMFLFSGTFFPLGNLPVWGRFLAGVLPLTHLVNLTRACAMGFWSLSLLWDLGYLLIFCAICFPLALSGMNRRLIH